MPAIKALTKEQELANRIKDVSKKTKDALRDAKISQKAVAEVAGVDTSAVSHQFNRGQLTLSVYLAAQILLEEK